MADKHINIKLGTKFNGGGISAAMRALKNLTRGATDIKSAFGMVSAAVSKAFSVVGSAFKFETQTTQFKTLIGNIDEARAHMADLKELGDTPPFSLEQFAAASRSLMVMTDGVLGYKKSLEMIGDAAAATGQPIEQMGHAVGRLFAVIRDGQPISRATMQLRNMGVITPEVAAKLDQMQKSGESNVKIWAEVESALAKYNGAMKETEQTGDGLMGAIKTRWDNIVRAFGEAFSDTAKDGMGEVLSTMEELEESGSIERWASSAASALASVVKAMKWVSDGISKIINHINEGRKAWRSIFGGSGESPGPENMEFLREEQVNEYTRKRYYAGADGSESVEVIEDEALKRKYEKRKKEEAKAQRAAEKEARKQEALVDGQRKTDERNAAEKAKKEVEAQKKAAAEIEKIKRQQEKLDRELHQKRMADLRAEIEAQKNAAEPLRAAASAAQSEFDRAFAMYRDPTRAAAEIAEERDYAEDLKQLHKDASRYGGKWRIDELSALMAAGDGAGVQSRLADWRKSRSFTPEVEAMVRASAAERTKTTAEEELRKIEHNTANLGQKLDELLAMKN